MSDLRDRDGYGEPEEDRLPWLEPVDEEPVEQGVSAARLIVGLLVALIALGLVVGGVYWLKQRATGGQQVASTEGTTIPAPAEPYKVKPDQPGGMQVKGQGDSSYAASEGADINGQIDLSATPEAPVTKAAPAPAPKPVAKPVEVAKAPEAPKLAPPAAAPKPATTPKPAAAPAAGGAQVQLGAFDSEAKANGVWKSLSGRVSALSGLTPTVTKAEVNGRTFYRLRAAAGSRASEVCAKLKVAGEACAVIG